MTSLTDLYRMAEDFGITIDCFEMRKREAFSIMDKDGDCYIAIDPTKLDSSMEESEILAHEIGHCCTGSFYNQYATCAIREKYENIADKWSISVRVPESELKEAVANGICEIWDLSEYFGVSESFMRKAFCWYKNGNLAADSYF